MRSLFQLSNYRKAIAALVEDAKNAGQIRTYRDFSDACRIDPTFFSNVLKERHHFNADQLYSVLKQLRLPARESEYITLLAELERSSHPERRAELKERLELLRRAGSDPKHALRDTKLLGGQAEPDLLAQQKYYLAPWTQVIDVALSLDRFRKSPALLQKELKIGAEELERAIAALVELGLLERDERKRLRRTEHRMHIEREHPLRTPHKRLLMHHCAANADFDDPESYSLTAAFTMRPERAIELKARIQALVSEAQARVDGSDSAEVFQFNIDLFPWTKA